MVETVSLDQGSAGDYHIVVVDSGQRDGSAGDLTSTVDIPAGVDLTTRPGDPCVSGKCADGLICMANVCHTICSGECGEKAPECTENEGCHWVTSFSAACMPGTAGYLQKCGGGVWCKGGYLCVSVSRQPARCLKLCKYGCPSGVPCGKTTNGCRVCIQ